MKAYILIQDDSIYPSVRPSVRLSVYLRTRPLALITCISCRLLKEAGPIIATSLTCIINKTIDTGLFPSQWKMAKVFPLYKKDDRTDAQNYRPISVLPAISKICERVVYDQLYGYLNSNGLLTKNQSGFRSLHSTVTALLHLTNNWYLNIDKGMTNLFVLLDLAKAFDTVSHNILLKKLELYGLKGVTLDCFHRTYQIGNSSV